MLELRVGPAVPRVLETEPDEGWLLMDDLGPDVVGDPDEAASEAAIRALVAIQRALTGAIGELIDLGCPVRRLADLPADLAGALDRSSRLESVGPALEEPRRIAWVEQAVRVVGDLGLPATLVHGDFHSLNVVRRDGRYVIFDWSDAALSHPLVDVATWLEWIDEPGRRAAAWGAWLAAWADACSPDSVRPLLDIVTGVGAAYQVVSYVGILEALEPATRSTMSRGMTTFLRRLDASIAGS